jgi:hypothetical protein
MFEGSEHYRTIRNNEGLTDEKNLVMLETSISPKSKGLGRCYNDRSLSRT